MRTTHVMSCTSSRHVRTGIPWPPMPIPIGPYRAVVDERGWKAMVPQDAALPTLPVISGNIMISTTLPASLPETNCPTQPLASSRHHWTSLTSAALTRSCFRKTVSLRLTWRPKTPRVPSGVRIDSPTYNIGRETRTVVAARMITRPKSVPPKSVGGDPHPHDHEILIYNPVALTSPIAPYGSAIWEKDKKGAPPHPFTRDMMPVTQLVEINQYPKTIKKGIMRVVVLIALRQLSVLWSTTPPILISSGVG
ncbi:hypothetical protein BGZ95_011927 [Linnemannia exigua]|uniref:Uncharacterized protein n=1 Tax=Linnemannia exigua TaxID=604196 RepID=A0AAD4D995_9FUNG|nr:hypothetical protein BGZ95_011927 [Linnemannia exigua]